MSRLFSIAALGGALLLGSAVTPAEAQNRYSAGRNIYRFPNYEYNDSTWCAPSASGSFFCFPKSENSLPRFGQDNGYAKNTWRYGLYKHNHGAGGANTVR